MYNPCLGKIFLTASVALLLIGCSGRRQAVTTKPAETVQTGVGVRGDAITAKDMSRQFYALYEADNRWERLRVPVTLRLMQPAKFSISGMATMVRGESMYISLRMLGFEVAQLYVDNDRLIVIDKYHKKYFSEPIADIFKGYGIGIADIQSLLLGHPFACGRTLASESDLKNFKFTASLPESWGGKEGVWYARSRFDSKRDYGFVFDDIRRLVGFMADVSNGHVATVEYSQIVAKGDGGFAGNAYIVVPLNSEKRPEASALFEWNFNKARWDGDVEAKSIAEPAGYQKVTVDELLKLLGKSGVSVN